MQFGLHGTTFGGGPLACAVALAVIDTTRLVHDFACVYPDWYPRRWAVFTRRACYLYYPGYFSYRPYGYYGFAPRHHRVPR